MNIRIKDLTEKNFDDLCGTCKGCIYWEKPEEFGSEAEHGHAVAEKRNWFIKTLKHFGSCGKIVYDGEKPIGFAQYAPASALPDTLHYESGPSSPVESGAVFLSCLIIWDEAYRRKGIGTMLLKNIIDDLRERGFKAIETFARKGSANNCSGPIALYTKLGFYVKRNKNEFPLVRFDL
jgi:ribosomal protein S18 acetylase RimI-like enzyme